MTIRAIDFETTGLLATDKVCEYGYSDYNPETKAVDFGFSSLCRVDAIPPEARAVHHIRAEDTASSPVFDAEDLVKGMLADGVLGVAAHMASFEAQWISRQTEGVLHLFCTYKAALRIWPEAPTHSNFGLFYWLEDRGLIGEYHRDHLMFSHRAGADSYVTAHLVKALYAAGATGAEMVRWTREPAMIPKLPIGKERGKPWHEVSQGFLEWMTRQADMEADLKWLAQTELDRRFSR